MDNIETVMQGKIFPELQYKTIGRRIFAGCIDASICYGFGIILIILLFQFKNHSSYVLLETICFIFDIGYVIITTKIFGGTLGKIYFNVKVFQNIDEGKITWKQSVLRESINVILYILNLIPIYFFMIKNNVFNYADYDKFLNENILASITGFIFLVIFIIEIGSSFLSKKRRAIHDLIAGTVVKKVGEYKKYSRVIAILATIISMFIYFKVLSLITG